MRRSPSETWMFSVVFWILCSWLPCLADWWQVSCSRHVVQLQQNICRQNDCEQEWEITFSPKKTWGSEQNFLRLDLMNIVSQIARNFAWQHLVYTKLAILNNSTCRLTGSQWSWRNTKKIARDCEVGIDSITVFDVYLLHCLFSTVDAIQWTPSTDNSLPLLNPRSNASGDAVVDATDNNDDLVDDRAYCSAT